MMNLNLQWTLVPYCHTSRFRHGEGDRGWAPIKILGRRITRQCQDRRFKRNCGHHNLQKETGFRLTIFQP
jgi:hypothetical protein